MSTTTNTIRLPAELAQDLAALDKRSRSLLSKGKCAAGVSLTAAAGAAIAYGWAYAVEPSAVLSSVHVPPEMLLLFSYAVGGQPWESGINRLMVVLTGWFPKVLAGMGIVAGALAAMFTGNFRFAVIPIFAAGPLLMAPMLLGDQSEQESDRAKLVRLAEDASGEGLVHMLDKADVTPDGRQYVLAQAAVAQAHKQDAKIAGDALKTLQQQVNAVHYALANGTKLTFDGAALYALDVNATGNASSPLAQRYYNEASESAYSKRSMASSLGTSALLFGAAAGALVLVGRRMRRRVDRLQSLVGPVAAASSAAKAADRPAA